MNDMSFRVLGILASFALVFHFTITCLYQRSYIENYTSISRLPFIIWGMIRPFIAVCLYSYTGASLYEMNLLNERSSAIIKFTLLLDWIYFTAYIKCYRNIIYSFMK